jgi:hypothetical protein
MGKFILQPWDEKLECEGKVTYHETVGAWNTIRLKRIFLDQFPQLKDKTARIKFKLEYYRKAEQMIESLKQKQNQKEGMPMLLYLYKE